MDTLHTLYVSLLSAINDDDIYYSCIYILYNCFYSLDHFTMSTMYICVFVNFIYII